VSQPEEYFAQFGVDERMIREAVAAAVARGGCYADVFFQHKVSRTVILEDGAVSRATTSVDLGAGVRVVSGDQTGYGYTEELTHESLRKAAATAAAIAAGPAKASPVAFAVARDIPRRYRLARPWEAVRIDDMLPLLRSVERRAFAMDVRIKKVISSLKEEHGAILVADSNGRIVCDLQPSTSLRIWCTAEHRGRREENYGALAGRADMSLYSAEKVARMVDETVRRTVVLFEASEAPSGEMPVVMAAGASGLLLHEAIGHGMEADFNRKNISVYADKMGKRIARTFVTVVDDGMIAGALGAINVDDESNIAGHTVLVEEGKLASYLHDRISAAHYGVAPTGNGRRESYRFPPLPRMRATYMLDGPHEREEVIRSVRRGIYCETLTSGQVSVGVGDFTFFVKNAHLIEDGELTRPIKNVNILGNGPHVLAQLDMVADDLEIYEGSSTCVKAGQTVPVSLGLPTVRIPRMTVAGGTSSVGDASLGGFIE